MAGIAEKVTALNNDEILRYSRHLIMPEVGMEGQLKLKQAKVLCIGAGGLGRRSLCIWLRREWARSESSTSMSSISRICSARSSTARTTLAARSWTRPPIPISEINPNVDVRKFDMRLSSANALELFREFDIIVDGTDNFPTRYLVNDACVLTGKPNVYGSIFRFEGQASVFATKEGPCYRCLYPEPPPPGLVPSCAEGGVLGILPGLVGMIQATEAIKLILGIGRAADRTAVAGRCAGDALPRTEAAEEPGLSGLRHASDRHGVDRLQPVLRHSWRRSGSA